MDVSPGRPYNAKMSGDTPHLRPSLTFPDVDLEAGYIQQRARELRPYLLVTAGIGTLVLALFGVIDHVLGRESTPLLMKLRYGLVLPYGILVLLLSRWISRIRTLVLLYQVYIVMVGLMVLGMMHILGAEGQYYYPGLLLILVFTFTVSGMDMRDALPPAFLLTGTSALYFTLTPLYSYPTRINNLVGLLGTLALGAGGGYMLERLRRLTFLHMEWLKKERNELERLSRTDSLTGLANRRALNEHLEQELKKAERYGIPVSFWMVDLDHFKPFNDTFGHPVGDRALQVLGATLQQFARRAGDLAARYGGDELAVFLFGCEPEEACRLATSFARKFQETTRQSGPHPLTVSLGVTGGVPPRGLQPTDLIRRADHALYQAKSSPSRVVCEPLSSSWTPEDLPPT